MFSTRLYRVFLTVVGISVVAARVEPPTNVTFRCGNMKNILEWEYANLSSAQGLRFRVDIGTSGVSNGIPNEIWVESPPLQADLSFLSSPDQEYLLTVTATIGKEESDPSPEEGIEFSYFQDSLVQQKCFLDFPSVTIIAKPNNELQLHFDHPWMVYHSHTKESLDENGDTVLPPFEYNIDIVNQSGGHTFTCQEEVCEETVAVDRAQEKYCVTVSGEVQKMAVKGKEEYCVHHPPKEASYIMYLYISIGLLAVVVSALPGYMMYHRVTHPDTSIPSFMTFNGTSNSSFSPQTHQITVEKGTVEVEPKSPTPLLTAIPEENSSPSPFSDYEVRRRLGLQSEYEGVSDVGLQQPNECPEYMAGNDFEEDDTPAPTGYERREVLVSIDPKEQTQGYRG